MGQRAVWALVVLALIAAAGLHGRRAVVWIAVAVLAGFGSITLLAADLTRSTNFFLPLTCAGAFAAERLVGSNRTRWLLALVGLNLVLPFAMLTYKWIEPIHSLPFELFRLFWHR